ncbi:MULTISPECIES: P-loop NTPase fold protein [unclassified Bradyrhizobium]|uniref:KAP family P-loop NTPase fold protein n=1 Tax=unclassified Bradyrhizobium TaxID=2631580 RepID=UPI001CD4345F|nr:MULTISPECIES: P-loop NTPase fold protein [unclassified Bradyrhizobium]MCA1372308.1 hypothetical protein [Bradyrhizobium sp. IC4060]MCA1482565.1 hypothetical protein [Bradyrhizobium sp. IC4061]
MTEDKYSDLWADDHLGRAEDAIFLKDFLLGRLSERKQAKLSESYVLNIDAQWGQGKSFFLSRFARMLRDEHFLVAEVNAWHDDHADDPLLSVMNAVDQAVAPLVEHENHVRDRWNEVKRTGAAIAIAAAKGAAVQATKKLIGSGIDEIGAILSTGGAPPDLAKTGDDVAKSLGDIIDEKGKALLATFRESKKTIERFRRSLHGFLQEASQKGQPLPLFILIDELDRCRPTFAIAMLERVKHLFDIDQVVFIIATDTAQLCHAVEGVYGGGFNSQGYLSRFFDRTYYFDRVSRQQFIENILSQTPLDETKISLPPNTSLATYLSNGFDFFGLPLRDIEQVFDILRSVVSAWNNRLKIEICVLFPVIVAHQQKQSAPFDHNFSAALNNLHQKLGGVDHWPVRFPATRHERSDGMTSGVSLANDFVSQSSRGLHDLNHEVTAPYSRWVLQRLSDEFAIAHGNQYRQGFEPISIVRKYPDMVRSAGRLVNRQRT